MRPKHSAAVPRWLALMCALVLVLTGCVSTDDDSDPSAEQTADDGTGGEDAPSGNEPLGTSIGTSTDGGTDLVFQIMELGNTPDDLLLLEFTISNDSGSAIPIQTALAGTHGTPTPSAVTLIDPENSLRYFPQMHSDGTCYCANWEGQSPLQSGDSINAWAVYPQAPETDAMIVDIPQAPPILDIPVGEGSEPPAAPEGELTEPKVLDLYSFADNLDGGTSRSESEEETAIMLSTDVLFDTNESTLTEDAEEVLAEAAAEIDGATGELVQVDGHADDTGTDAINDPLSLERAQSVQERLEDLVTRSGIEYESEGHGSADPIADNDTEEGREKNRRVTVTFAK